MQNKWKYLMLELLKIILYIILAILTVVAGKKYMKPNEIVEDLTSLNNSATMEDNKR